MRSISKRKYPTRTDTTGETKVEVIVNGGQTLAEKTFTGGSATVEFNNLSTGYGYYYLRITQADKQIAVDRAGVDGRERKCRNLQYIQRCGYADQRRRYQHLQSDLQQPE